jgi:hypothetical protein
MRWLGKWRARAPSNSRDITVQALLTGSHVPHPELVPVDSGYIFGQTVGGAVVAGRGRPDGHPDRRPPSVRQALSSRTGWSGPDHDATGKCSGCLPIFDPSKGPNVRAIPSDPRADRRRAHRAAEEAALPAADPGRRRRLHPRAWGRRRWWEDRSRVGYPGPSRRPPSLSLAQCRKTSLTRSTVGRRSSTRGKPT